MTENEEKAVKFIENIKSHATVTLDHIAKEEPNVSPLIYKGREEKADTILKMIEELRQYRAIGTPEECRAAVEKQKIDKDLESHDEKHILKYCISLMQELVGKFEEWYEYVHGEDAIKELCEDEKFCYRMSYFNIVQELFLFGTSHSGGTSTRAKCEQLGVDSSDEIEFSFGDDEE
jgi:hypothetical protein